MLLVSAAAVWYGGLDVIQHITLRFLLRRYGYLPKDCVRFLDYATRLIFLQKVGPGYIFIHRQLLDYFSGLEVPQTRIRRELLDANISGRHREEEKREAEQQPELEMECALSRANTEPIAEAEQLRRSRERVLSNFGTAWFWLSAQWSQPRGSEPRSFLVFGNTKQISTGMQRIT